MSNTPPQVVSWPRFERQLERLKAKYPQVEKDVREAIASPTTRIDAVPGYSQQLWKARVPSSDMRRGARGGFRLYLWMEHTPPDQANVMYPIVIYPKSKRADLSKKELRAVVKRLLNWIDEIRDE